MLIKPLSEYYNDMLYNVAHVYIQEWGHHFADEWGLYTIDDIATDIRNNFTLCTFVALENDKMIGTIALLPEDLKTHSYLSPWITCLWVDPQERGKGIGKSLANYALNAADSNVVYLWCTTEREKNMYIRWGCQLLENTTYNNAPAWVMCKYKSRHS